MQAAIIAKCNRLNDADFAASLPSLIQEAEDEIADVLRRTTVINQTTIQQDVNPLPADCAELRSARLVSGIPILDKPIEIGTLEQLSELRAALDNVAGRPARAAVVTGNLYVAPSPDQAYTVELTYYQAVVPLSTTNPTNSVLTEFPRLYMFGVMREAEIYLENDARSEYWDGRFQKALEQIRLKRDNEEYGASLRPVRLPMNGFN
ncbi:MAG TPA: hypothetical protein VFA81_04085 [Burkholderiales bacterium]|nr:hypothetical protein [Burkholderiales bacterium]